MLVHGAAPRKKGAGQGGPPPPRPGSHAIADRLGWNEVEEEATASGASFWCCFGGGGGVAAVHPKGSGGKDPARKTAPASPTSRTPRGGEVPARGGAGASAGGADAGATGHRGPPDPPDPAHRPLLAVSLEVAVDADGRSGFSPAGRAPGDGGGDGDDTAGGSGSGDVPLADGSFEGTWLNQGMVVYLPIINEKGESTAFLPSPRALSNNNSFSSRRSFSTTTGSWKTTLTDETWPGRVPVDGTHHPTSARTPVGARSWTGASPPVSPRVAALREPVERSQSQPVHVQHTGNSSGSGSGVEAPPLRRPSLPSTTEMLPNGPLVRMASGEGPTFYVDGAGVPPGMSSSRRRSLEAATTRRGSLPIIPDGGNDSVSCGTQSDTTCNDDAERLALGAPPAPPEGSAGGGAGADADSSGLAEEGASRQWVPQQEPP